MVLSTIPFMIENKLITRKIALLKKGFVNFKEIRKINLVFIDNAINLDYQIYQGKITSSVKMQLKNRARKNNSKEIML